MVSKPIETGDGKPKEAWLVGIRKNPFQLAVLVLTLVNITVMAVNIGLWTKAAAQKLFVAADFTSFYTGYYMVRVGQGENLYDANLQAQYQREFMGGAVFEGGVLLFPNPPFVAIIFSPISLLLLGPAFYLWSVIQLGLLVWVMISLNRLFSHWSREERIAMMVAILAFWPLTYTFLLGQFSLILIIGLLYMYKAMKQSKLALAGISLSALSIKPHYLLIPGMLTLNKRYWRVAVSAALIGIFLFISSSLIIGVKPWIEYIRQLRDFAGYFNEFGTNPNTELTIRGMLTNLLGNPQGSLINTISAIILAAGMLCTWLLWRKGISQEHPRFTLYFALTIALPIVLSMHSNPHDALIYSLTAVLFYDYLRQNEFPKKAYSLFLLVSPVIFLFATFYRFDLFGVIRPQLLMILILLGWVTWYVVKDLRSTEKANLSASANQ